MKNLLFLVAIVLSQLAFSQQPAILKLKNYRIAYLSDSLRENSGLTFFENRLYTFNDSGNSSEVFEINRNNGKILKKIQTPLPNEDWESVAADSAHIYLGDFGNNGGARRNLAVYKLDPKTLNYTAVPFFYPEQKDFSFRNINNDFDGEAMIFLNGGLHLFTKEWVSKAVTHYRINPLRAEIQPAEKVETYKLGFSVTDAAYFDKKLYLVGYTKKTEVFLAIFTETKPGIFFEQPARKFYLGSAVSIGQIEGVAADAVGIFISGEAFHSPIGLAKQSLYFIPYEKLRNR